MTVNSKEKTPQTFFPIKSKNSASDLWASSIYFSWMISCSTQFFFHQFVLLEKSRLYLAKKENSTEWKKEEFIFFPEKFVLAGRHCSYVQNAEPYYSCPSINPSAQSVWSSNSLQSAEFARYSQIKICPRTFVREGHLDPSLPPSVHILKLFYSRTPVQNMFT